MSSDNQFTALGPAAVGFQTHGANIDTGADVTGRNVGLKAHADNGVGVLADSANGMAIAGTSINDIGVTGRSSGGDGVHGVTIASGMSGVAGISSGPGETHGVFGECLSDDGAGVKGISTKTRGVWGVSEAYLATVGDSHTGTGVFGATNTGFGVIGTAHQGGGGVFGSSQGGIGVHGVGTPAGLFEGDVRVTGTLTKGALAFRIDHPLDPANKYLSHSGVESPDMKTMYDGTVVLDGNGEAVVKLPDWFEALNGELRYQLTCLRGYAPIYIAEEVHVNSFKIAGGRPAMKVCWQVTGVRQDAYATVHRVPIEEDKLDEERGYYLHPEVHGAVGEKSTAEIMANGRGGLAAAGVAVPLASIFQ